jgi:hypothetical protein
LAPFFEASGLQPNSASSLDSPVAAFEPPPDSIASVRSPFPLLAVAVDDASTTDVDDAVSYEPPHPHSGSCVVHIHISDVDRWLPPSTSHLFSLLQQRTSSAYFPAMHVPLLPHTLCSLPSLLPLCPNLPPLNQPNPCITISATICSDGSISKVEVAPYYLPKLIRLSYDVVDRAIGTSESCATFFESWQSAARPSLRMPSDPRKGFAYDEEHVLAFHQLQQPPDVTNSVLTQQLREMLLALSSLAARMRNHRQGGLEEAPQTDLDVDFYSEFHAAQSLTSPASSSPAPQSPSSSPSLGALDVCGRMSSSSTSHSPSAASLAPTAPPPRLNARHTIAEFMVAACISCASWCRDRNLPIHYRSQPPPNLDLSQLQQHSSRTVAAVAKSSLSSLPLSSSVFPSAELLGVYASKMMTLSSMQGATTSIQPKRHHGIGADAYTQCTSPIRRFSDLLVQRQMKSALGFCEGVSLHCVQASLARQNVVRASVKRVERLLERRAILSILLNRASSADDPVTFSYHCIVLKSLPPGRGSPASFGDFVPDVSLLPPLAAAELLGPLSSAAAVRCGWFMILIPALGVLERCLLPLGTPPGTCFRVAAVTGSCTHGRISFIKLA